VVYAKNATNKKDRGVCWCYNNAFSFLSVLLCASASHFCADAPSRSLRLVFFFLQLSPFLCFSHSLRGQTIVLAGTTCVCRSPRWLRDTGGLCRGLLSAQQYENTSVVERFSSFCFPHLFLPLHLCRVHFVVSTDMDEEPFAHLYRGETSLASTKASRIRREERVLHQRVVSLDNRQHVSLLG
jgi:hypothetical protein